MKISLKQIRKICMMLCFAFISVTAFAQSVINGVVTNVKDEMPVQGVTVSVKGTKIAAQTNADGTFSISAPSNGTLIFTSVNFGRQEVAVNGSSSLAVSLNPTTTSLDEVVVVGYGTQQRKYMTGSVSKIDSKAFTSTPAPSFDAALQGRAPGLQVQQANGSLGGAVRIRLEEQVRFPAAVNLCMLLMEFHFQTETTRQVLVAVLMLQKQTIQILWQALTKMILNL